MDTGYSDIRNIVKRGFGVTMGMGTCWLGNIIPLYTCLMESFAVGGGSVANQLCANCNGWFINNVADPRGWY